MIMVNISGSERQMDEIDGSWIHQQIDRRCHDRQPVWVLVRIRTDDWDMILCTANCPRSDGGGRAPNPRERHVFDLWHERGLDNGRFDGGNLIAFLKQLRHLM